MSNAAHSLAALGWVGWHCPHCGTFQGYEVPDGRLCIGFPGVTGGMIRVAKWDCVCGEPLYWTASAKARTNLKAGSDRETKKG
jgi:hypothetical protein